MAKTPEKDTTEKWQNFLDRQAESKLDDHQKIILKEWFPEPEKALSNKELIERLEFNKNYTKTITKDTIQRQKTIIYQKFESNCPQLANQEQKKYKVLHSCLKEFYESECEDHKIIGNPPQLLDFFGREDKLKKLEHWINRGSHYPRMFGILGMGGIGKTSLSVKFAEEYKDRFNHVFWIELSSAISLRERLEDKVMNYFSNENFTSFTIDTFIDQLISYLNDSPCLIILDNMESILQIWQTDDIKLFEKLIERPHKSFLLFTSREKIQIIEEFKDKGFIGFLEIEGLSSKHCEKLFQKFGNFYGTPEEWERLIKKYSGNPQILKIVARHIRDTHQNSIGNFLKEEGGGIFKDLFDFLYKIISPKLSKEQAKIIYWLAINREPTSIETLQGDLIDDLIFSQKIVDTIKEINRRFLPIETIEKNETSDTDTKWFLQQLLVEYFIEQIIQQSCEEIKSGELDLLRHHSLMKATAKEYIRSAQNRLIIRPLIQSLSKNLIKQIKIESNIIEVIKKKIKELLNKLKGMPSYQSGYATGNLINLLCHLNKSSDQYQPNNILRNYDLSDLIIWQADFRDVTLHNVNFHNSDLSKSVFAETVGVILTVKFSRDSTYLASGDSKGEINIWNIKTNQKHLNFQSHLSWVRSITFKEAEDSNKINLISAGDDKKIKLWEINTQDGNYKNLKEMKDMEYSQ